jgi:hypothetical protein
MAITLTPVGTGIKAQNATGAVEVTLTQAAPAGKLLILAVYSTSVVTLTGVTDDKSNSFTVLSAATSAQGNGYWVHARVTTGLASGHKIYATFSSAVSRRVVVAVVVDGAAASFIDAQGSSAQTGTGTTPVVNTGPQAEAGEMLLAWLFATSPLVTITEDGQWDTLGEAVVENRKLHLAGREMATTAADTYEPGFNSSRDWSANWLALKAAGSTGHTLTATSGAFALTARAAALRGARKFTATARNYALAGINAAVRRGYRLRADVRDYVLTRCVASVRRGLSLACASASRILTGIAANLIRMNAGRTLGAATASFSLIRRPAGMKVDRKLRTAVEGYAWARLASGLRWSRRMVAAPGAHAFAGGASVWDWTHILKPALVPFGLTGAAATLRYRGGLGWQPVQGAPETWTPMRVEPELWTQVGDTPEVWS